MRMRIFSLTATEKRLLKKFSWRAAPKLYTPPGVSICPEKKPDTCWVIKCPGTVRRPAAQAKRVATHGRTHRQRGRKYPFSGLSASASPCTQYSLSPGLKSDILSGKTGRKRPQPPASSHIVQSADCPENGRKNPNQNNRARLSYTIPRAIASVFSKKSAYFADFFEKTKSSRNPGSSRAKPPLP